MEDPPGPSDPILKSRRYVLGEEEESFAIWDRRSPGEPIERFPATPEGFEAAEARYKKLRHAVRQARRADRRARIESSLPRLLVVVIVASGLISIAARTLFSLGPVSLFETVLFVDEIGFRLMEVAGFLTAGLVLLLLVRGTTAEAREGIRTSPADRVTWGLAWTVAVGVGVWIAAGAVAAWFPYSPFDVPPVQGPGFFIAGEESTLLGRIAFVAEAVAFRVWVGAAVLLVLRWTWRWRTVGPSGSTEGP